MIEDAAAIPEGRRLAAGLCIVGGGPAGIALALRLDAARVHVLLLESGALRPQRRADALNRGEVADPALHRPPDWYRRRALGGATGLWGGRCVPLDPIDFTARPWIPWSGWPIGHGELAPYYAEANVLCEAGAFAYRARDAFPAGLPPVLAGFAGDYFNLDTIERFSCPADFGVRYRARLAASRYVTVLHGATVTGIETTADGSTVRALAARTAHGSAFTVLPRAAVLAAGGLEVPRLLLASGIGGDSGCVGRFYMCHLAGTTGTLRPRRAVWHDYARARDGVYCRPRFALNEAAQAAMGTANFIARLHHPRIADPAHGSAALSLLALARPLIRREFAVRLAGPGEAGGAWLRHGANLLRDPAGAPAFLWHWLRRRLLATRKYPSVVVRARSGTFSIDFHAEQVPNPASRVTLGSARDRHGVPVLRVDWRHDALDLHTVRRGIACLADDIAASGCGELRFDPAEVEADALRDGAYGGHHIGTARMSATPRAGVVNRDGRVHGMRNLYVAGSAVFPTSGQANPTLTIVALALRLGDHLARRADTGVVLARGGVDCALL